MAVELKEKIERACLSIIIVEDYKLTRFGLKTSLNEFDGLKVTGEAESAEEGLQIIEKTQPDIVLMDLGLPGMNGIEATQKVREISPATKVIVLTSHEREEEVIAAMGAGAHGYCLKDISPESLMLVIKSIGRGATWIDPGVSQYILNLMPKPENVKFNNSYDAQDGRAHLTERELEVLKLLVKGKSNTEIAKDLIVSVHTAKAHVCSILQKLCVDDRVQAAVKAIKEKII